jgi:Zn-dependent protease with chaperone function
VRAQEAKEKLMRVLILVALFCLPPLVSSLAQTSPATPAPAPAAQPGDDYVPVPEPGERAIAYHRSGIAWWVVTTLWGWLIPALFLFTGFSARIRDWARRIGRGWFFTIGVYFAIFSVLSFLIDLPLSYYLGYVRQHEYGMSTQSLGKWFQDSALGLAFGILGGFLFLWIPYLLLKRSPRRWWLYTGLLAIPFLLLMILIQPIWVDPWFNKFGPMKNKELETKILALAERAGIEGSRVFEVAKSEDTKALNAYVTGFGATKRIVLWDTTIAKLSEDELLYVIGHEMGHYVMGHVWKTIGFFSLLILLALYAIHRTAGWLIARYRGRFGFNDLSDVASFPLIVLLLSAYLFLILPIGLAYSRGNEHESDRFGLEILQNNRAAATAFVKLQEENLGIPRPHWLIKLWQASHPPLGERIDFCNEYRPWQRGEALQYGHLFKTTPRT